MSVHDSIVRVILQTQKQKEEHGYPDPKHKCEKHWNVLTEKLYIKSTSNLKELWSQSSSDHGTLHLLEDSYEPWDRWCAVLGKKWCLGNRWKIHIAESNFDQCNASKTPKVWRHFWYEDKF